MTQATINDHTYSDDGTSSRDMLNGGHRAWFLPMVGDVATVAGTVASQAAQTAIDAVNAANAANAVRGTSTTNLTVGAGIKTLTTQAGKQFAAGNYVTISRTSAPATMMHGLVTSYSGTTLVVEAATSAGGGTYTDWTIALSGPQGATGATGTAGDIGYLAKTSAYTITAADKAKLIDCTSGTFTLAFQACATLGANWATYIRNSGAGIITLDPNSAETIDGAATFELNIGSTVKVQCNGTVLRVIGISVYGGTQSIHVRDQKSSGTNGGDSALGWQFRQLNTVVSNTLVGSSLANDGVTIPPGKYMFFASTTARGGSSGNQRAALYNVTNLSTIIQGVNSGGTASNFTSIVSGTFSVLATTVVKLRQWISSAQADTGLGFAISTGEAEVYSDLQIWRVA